MTVCYSSGVRKGYLSEMFLSFQGEGLHAGRRQLFIRTSGCHLRCRYCDTPASLERSGSARIDRGVGQPIIVSNPLSTDDVVGHARSIVEAGGGADGVAITGGEPLLQADFLAALLDDPLWPRPRMLETSGTQPERLVTVLPVVDSVSMDIKLPSNTGEPAFWDAHARFLAAAAGKAFVKVLADDATNIDDVGHAARIVREIAPTTPVFLQPITTETGHLALSPDTLRRFFDCLRSELPDVRVLPQTHKMLSIQ